MIRVLVRFVVGTFVGGLIIANVYFLSAAATGEIAEYSASELFWIVMLTVFAAAMLLGLEAIRSVGD